MPEPRPAKRRREFPFNGLARVALIAILLVVNGASVFTGRAAGADSTSELEERMDSIQARLDQTTARIEDLRTQKEHVEGRIAGIKTRVGALSDREARLESTAVNRAEELYKSGTSTMVATLLDASSIHQVMDRAEVMSQVSMDDSNVFISLSRAQAELKQLTADLKIERGSLATAESSLADESKRLQTQFADIKSEYMALARKTAPATTQVSAAPSAPLLKSTDGMYCPVAGPVSFVDSWGAPRSGHTHQGVDMMAAYGTPIAAVTDGTITYAAYDGSGGNMLWLSGTDGNAYYYMHNQENYVGQGASVSAGEIIGTVGDTGNAAGTPHLHWEYHPGGGAAVNPTPLAASLC
ncbi:MAG TPA: peptidoglycan DD-metalloendopeptidase family protein [Actinomycetota bacterium]|nr:peptidoglycan DD-metalloendopeptidase family protein [Actinomycetota bacterium]